MAEHDDNRVDIAERERTFAGFVRMIAWVAGVSILILIFLALVNA